jgi:MoaA/NifB/PqqE/SkfB family radical SAM enzyme
MKVQVYPWPNQPNKVAIYTGNTCNLACVMCGPGASSRWREELGLGKYTGLDTDIADVDVDHLEHVTFTGGEPLLNKVSLEILARLQSTASVQFHSNGTILPGQEYLDLFARFNNIVVVFSIDDIEEQFEYLRWPGKWSEVASNILWFKNNCPANVKFAFNVVVSRLNEHTYHRVEEWVNNNIPANKSGVKTEVFTNEPNGLLRRSTDENSCDPVAYLAEIDQRRRTSWQRVFPLVKL